MSNEQSKVVTKVIDVRHKAPDQAIHELMQAAKDGFAVTKVVTRFNHTHVYLETSSKQIAESQQNTKSETAGVNSNGSEPDVSETKSDEVVGKEPTKVEPVKTTAKKTASKTTAAKKVEQGDKDAE